MKFPAFVKELFLPNEKVTRQVYGTLIGFWIVVVAAFWYSTTVPLMPQLTPVVQKFGEQWVNGSPVHMWTSLTVSFEAIALATVIGLTLCYTSSIAFFRPVVTAISKFRFLSLFGINLLFVAAFHGHFLKVAVLTFVITIYLVNDVLRVIDEIPEKKFEYARTLGLNRWQVQREVVIRGTLHDAIDSIRSNAAMAWMMLAAVEGLMRSEGGIGALLLALQKSFNLPAIWSIQIMVLAVGIGQDMLLRWIRALVCPYTVRS
jgi:ABC-type nitrate/sulfonate/bicarbonate transport system permease component